MSLTKVVFIFLISVFLSCSSVVMKIGDKLKENSVALNVKGKQGWQINRILRFGEFKTSKVKGGWKTGSSLHFIMDFEEQEQKYRFNQYDTLGNKTKVYCVGALKADHFDVFNGIFTIPVDVKDVFSANIIADSNKTIWKLILFNPNQIAFTEDVKGALKFENTQYKIKPVRELEEGSLGPRIIGFDFRLGDEIVAAVQILDDGIVWLSNKLNPEQRLILASACSALMLRDDLEIGEDE